MAQGAATAKSTAGGAGEGLSAPKEIAAAMESGEKLLWFAHPNALLYTMTKMKSLVMALPFFGLSVFWFNSYMQPTSPSYMSVIGYVFIAFGLYHVFIPAWTYFIARFFVAYAITDKRVLVVQIYPRNKVKAVDMKGIIGVTRVEHSGDKGTLHILIPILGDSKKKKEGDFAEIAATLYGINHAKRIEEAVNQLREVQQGGAVPTRSA